MVYRLIIYSLLLLFVDTSYASGWIDFWGDNVSDWLKWWNGDLISTIQNMVWYLIWLLYLIALIITLYWGFSILTAGWDEEKVKKWRSTILRWVIGLIIIFLASTLVNWVITVMSSDKISWNTSVTTNP